MNPVEIAIESQTDLRAVQQTRAAFNSLNAQLTAQSKAIKQLTAGFDAFQMAQRKVLGVVSTVGELTNAVYAAYQAFSLLNQVTSSQLTAANATRDQLKRDQEAVKVLRSELDALQAHGKDVTALRSKLNLAIASGDYAQEMKARREVLAEIQRLNGLVATEDKKRTEDQITLEEQRLIFAEGLRETQAAKQQRELDALKFGYERGVITLDAYLEERRKHIQAAYDREIEAAEDAAAAAGRTYDAQLRLLNESKLAEERRLKALQDLEITRVVESTRDKSALALPETFTARLQANIKLLREEWGNMSVTMADTLSSTVVASVQGLSSALANVIVGTQTAAQAFGQFSVQMATSFIASVVQMVLMAKVAIPILTALGVLSAGSTAATGATVTTAALMSTLATSNAIIGRAAGGLIPGAPSERDNRLAMVATGEYVARSSAVDYYGAGLFEALNQMRVPRAMLDGYRMPSWRTGSSAFSQGGLVAGGTSSTPINVGFFEDRRRRDQWLRSRQGRSLLFDITSGQLLDLGVV